jgi:hypothetical protein
MTFVEPMEEELIRLTVKLGSQYQKQVFEVCGSKMEIVKVSASAENKGAELRHAAFKHEYKRSNI